MNRRKKYILTGLLVVVVMVAGLSIALNWYAKKVLVDFLVHETPPNIALEYTDLHVNVFQGKLRITDLSAAFSYPDTINPHTKIITEEMTIAGFSYWQYLINQTVQVRAILLQNPDLQYYVDKEVTTTDTISNIKTALPKAISIQTIDIKNGHFTLLNKETNDTLVKADQINFTVNQAKTDSIQINEKIPFTYGDYSFFARHLFTDLGPYESMAVDSFLINDKVLHFRHLTVQPKYGKRELSRILKTERDHTTIRIADVFFRNIDFGYHENRFYVSADAGEIKRPHLEIYRDKLIPNDLRIKPLYSRAIRELPIDLDIKELSIDNGHIGYEERAQSDTKAGRLTFDDITVTMQNISNNYAPGGETHINAKMIFMEKAPIALDWSFDVNSKNDSFQAKGTFKDVDLSYVNSFLVSSLRAQAKGHASAIYFTIGGNSVHSSGEMKMKYDNFEFIILRKDRQAVNKLQTAIGKILLNDGSKRDAEGFRNGQIQVQRDPTKSFFNYLWLNVQDGAINTITGSEKKRKEKNS